MNPLPRWTLLLLPTLIGCAGHHAISGVVTDRNGRPLDRVIVSLEPGGVELVTDQQGAFTIDYLRDEEGRRVRLAKRTDYKLSLIKPGYNVSREAFFYKRGELALEALTMVEDVIEVDPSDDDIDPTRFRDRTHSSGSNYEGE